MLVVIALAALAASFSPILDCDETFNYWEPLHYLLYGNGLKPWEYSEKYALRPYALLYLLLVPARLMRLFGIRKWAVFKICKFVLAFCNLYALHMLCIEYKVDNYVLLTPGILLAAPSFLPNSIAATLSAWSLVFWRRGHRSKMLFTLATMTVLTWPYAAVFYSPLVFTKYVGKQVRLILEFWRLALATLFSTISILAPIMTVDYLHYGKVTMTWFNAVCYNLIKGNDTRFGVESSLFYLKNSLINYGLLFLDSIYTFILPRNLNILSSIFSLSLLLPSSRPHKEERFLYPLIPLMVAGCSLSKHKYFNLLIALFGAWRMLTVRMYYGGVEDLFQKHPFAENDIVCMKDQWYRFPSHFAFEHKETRVGFLESMKFQGALPQYYSQSHFTFYSDQNQRSPTQFTDECTLYFGLKEEFDAMDPVVCTKVLDLNTRAPGRWIYLPRSKLYWTELCIFEEN
jgi:alpha-1,2-mannosyltransferase